MMKLKLLPRPCETGDVGPCGRYDFIWFLRWIDDLMVDEVFLIDIQIGNRDLIYTD